MAIEPTDAASHVSAFDEFVADAVADCVQGHGEPTPLFAGVPEGPFDVVLLDPPWSYSGQQDKWGAAAKFYPTLSEAQIASFPMDKLLAPRGVVFCWATCPKLHTAIKVVESWGLHYRGVAFVWVKTTKDGKPLRAQGVRPSIVKPLTELVIAASMVEAGRPMPIADEAVIQTVFAPKRLHSQKPEEVAHRIERLYPDASKIELFARTQRNGWRTWGNEVPVP